MKRWHPTTDACDRLNVCSRTLARMRNRGEITKGIHWKVKNPTARRLTYLYDVAAIDANQKAVVVEVPVNSPERKIAGI